MSFPLKYTKQFAEKEGPPCAPTCSPEGREGDLGKGPTTGIGRCVDLGWIKHTQYIYRYDSIHGECLYDSTQIPSEYTRSLGYGVLLVAFLLLLLLVAFFVCKPTFCSTWIRPLLALAVPLLSWMAYTFKSWYYIQEASLKEAMDITGYLCGPVSQYNWDFSLLRHTDSFDVA